MKTKSGMTLIETLISTALFALFLGGGIAAAFYLADASEKETARAGAEIEAEFLLRKMDWALTDVQTVHSPAFGTTSAVLSLDKNGFAANPVIVDAFSGHARIAVGGVAPAELTGDRVTISGLVFENISTTSGPIEIRTVFTADGKEYEITKYLP